jgi:D-glycero-D-manno-heptose 1,7-bisphosphate phosphatase
MRAAVFLDSDAPAGPSSLGRPAVFLDRDGVLNRRKLNLVRTLDQLRILPGVGASVARFTQAGFAVVIATNQEWVGQGYIKREEHDAIMGAVVDACQEEGGKVDGVYACLHPKTQDCHDRKPKPGMLTDAARDLGLDLRRSFMVGDNRKDVQAGRAAGTTTVLVDPRLRTWLQRATRYADHVAPDLLGAADWILDRPR